MSSPLVLCPSCGCHAKIAETDCPHCGARLRRPALAYPRAAAAVFAGLTATIALSAADSGCGGKVVVDGPSGGSEATGAGGAGGAGGHGGAPQSTSVVTVGDGVGGGFAVVASSGGIGGFGGLPAPPYGIAPIPDAGDEK